MFPPDRYSLQPVPRGAAWVMTGAQGWILGLRHAKAGTQETQAQPHVPAVLVEFLP